MKNIIQKLISIVLVFALMNVQGFANALASIDNETNDIESFNEVAFYSEFTELEDLENYLSDNNLNYEEVKAVDRDLLASVSPEAATPFDDSQYFSRDPFGVSSFIWGCVAGVSGIILVYLLTNSKAEARKAYNGCLTSHIVGIIAYVGIMLITASSGTSSTY